MPRPRFTLRQMMELGPAIVGEDSVPPTSADTELDEDEGGRTDADYTVGGVMLPLKVIENARPGDRPEPLGPPLLFFLSRPLAHRMGSVAYGCRRKTYGFLFFF